ncbi:MAG: elyC [Acidobacteria bacterium]|nr:elyC [Acidobacteriota bacterium]
MQAAAEFVKEFLVPGSAWFLIIAASICAMLLYASARLRRIGRVLLAALVVIYWLMSLPVVAVALQKMKQSPAAAAALPAQPLPIVVLGNGLGGYDALGGHIEVPLGRTAMNILFALDRYRHYPQSMLIASGGPPPGVDGGASEASVIAAALSRNGVPSDHVLLEATSTTTREQAIATSRLLAARGEPRCIVVTAPQQMARAVELFRHEGIAALPLAAGAILWSPETTAHWWLWLAPSTEARAVSRDVVYESIAWPYYRLRGWVS